MAACGRTKGGGDDGSARRARSRTVVIVAVLLVVVANRRRVGARPCSRREPTGREVGVVVRDGRRRPGRVHELLADYGYPVRRIRGDLAQADIDPGATLILTGGNGDASSPRAMSTASRPFVALGGRAVLVDLPARDPRTIAGIDPTVVDGVRDYHDFAESFGRAPDRSTARRPRTPQAAT